MSRIGKQPVSIPQGVTAEISGNSIKIKGPKGELKRDIPSQIKVEQKDSTFVVTRKDDTKFSRSLHGLYRALIANMVEGVSQGYVRKLEIVGVGFKFKPNGNKLNLNVGFSHPVDFVAPQGITFEENKDEKNVIIIKGIDKEVIGEVAAKIRAIKPPEPYKGKGIRYFGEHIEKKAGKSAATGGKAA